MHSLLILDKYSEITAEPYNTTSTLSIEQRYNCFPPVTGRVVKMSEDVGFIGVGNMGYRMAGNVRRKMPSSATLHIYDISKDACQRLKDEVGSFGPVEIANSAKEVTEKSHTVITMVPMGQHARAVYLDKQNGVLAAKGDSDRLFLECSTIDVATCREIGQQIAAANAGIFVDTPVSGGIGGAAAGTLSFMCGRPKGPEEDPISKRVFEIICWMGSPQKIRFCGELGTGLVSKIANNYIAICTTSVIGEAMAFGMRYGVDKRTLYECIAASSGDSWVLHNNHVVPGVIPTSPSSNGFKLTFAPKMSVKDITLGIQSAEQVGINPSMGKAAVELYQKVADDARTAVSTS
ncbi:hypothetical protein HRR80_009558 [Exophiala dermatitidis]|uniref:3-hydroxyisobutyrate dehydrogenase n=2 Tax=Exophiala dermatitidis TaxID=5970 RepID=A0AAN6EJH4_EXODE|nr:hypothetical protein HRR77_009570 [Exophiala dermatitidis]KAJ4552281.1 hypothetical protein HRR79_009792 [Exophiala dermatitidis]KAJ4562690.1 hypothetical protein HRR82_009565 [Exophiala dermatitidis]KAJ4599260.1 hypothetical protein HRR85_009556 [Exophiala dermatitidis]KAJ4610584.1 hypothetical protein HRR86_009559 [Exophiala dermatitidis]